ncbi:MAG: hypothetical protein MUE82_00190 [Chloroflexi bacterium]|nr:hypothetical protein [Chloroflexota bacterium]
MKRTVAATAALSLATVLVAACTGAASTPPTTPPAGGTPPGTMPTAEPIMHPTGANELVLRQELGGGFVPYEWILSNLPIVSIYGDGRVITQGPRIEIYPGPALPNLRVARISEDGLQKILAAAAEAGILGNDAHYDYPGIADAPTTIFTVNAGGATSRVSAYALGIGEDASMIPPADAAARAELADFAAKLGDLPGWLGPDVVSADEPFDFASIRVYAQAADPTSQDQGIEPTVVDWPLAVPLATFGEPFRPGAEPAMRCGVVAGDDLATLRPALEAANQLTYWRSGGETFSLILRPLLPEESGCPAE